MIKEEMFKEVIQSIVKESEKINEPEQKALLQACMPFIYDDNIDLFFSLDYNIKNIKNYILKQLNKENDKERLIILYEDFVEDVITDFIQREEGFTCSVDKSRHIIRNYIKCCKGEDTILDNSLWYAPSKGTIKDWNDFVESILELAIAGKTSKFMNEYRSMLGIYI